MAETLIIGAGILLMVIGVLGTILPILPGAPLVASGILLIAWHGGFQAVSVTSIVIIWILALLTLVIDFLSGILGAKRVKAHPLALFGAAVGAILGIFGGVLGIFIGPLIGAFAGQLIASADLLRAGEVGFATGVAIIIGNVIKLAVVFIMIAFFIFALWYSPTA